MSDNTVSTNEVSANTETPMTETAPKKIGFFAWTSFALGAAGLVGGGYVIGKLMGPQAAVETVNAAARSLFG